MNKEIINKGKTDNIIAFPTKNKHNQPNEFTRLERKMLSSQKLLRFHYKNIREALENLANHQLKCAKSEGDYDALLLDYAHRIGIENVPKKYMDYSKKTKPDIDEDGNLILTLV